MVINLEGKLQILCDDDFRDNAILYFKLENVVKRIK